MSAEQFSSPFSTMLEEIGNWSYMVASLVARKEVLHTHQASRALLVSGQAQQALHLGFSPDAVPDEDAGATGWAAETLGAATPWDALLPILQWGFVQKLLGINNPGVTERLTFVYIIKLTFRDGYFTTIPFIGRTQK